MVETAMLTLLASTTKVCSVAFSPNGEWLAVASWNFFCSKKEDRVGGVKLWDLSTRSERVQLVEGDSSSCCVAFSPDGRLLAAGDEKGKVRVWDTATGLPTVRLFPAQRRVLALAFVPTTSTLFVGTAAEPRAPNPGGELFQWPRLRVCGRPWVSGLLLPGRGSISVPGGVLSLACAADGKTLVVGAGDGTLRMHDPDSGVVRSRWKQSGGLRTLALSPDGRTLAVASGFGIQLWDLSQWDLADNKQLAPQKGLTLKGHSFLVWSLAFSPDGRLLLSGGWDFTVRLWDVVTGQERASYNWDLGKVHSVAFSPDGMKAAAGGDDRGVMVWDLE